MEGISHSINKTQLVKTLKSPIQAQEDALTAQSLAKILWWLILGSLTAQSATPYPHTAPQLGLGPAQQPDTNNCEMLPKPGGKRNQKAKGPKAPEKQKKPRKH